MIFLKNGICLNLEKGIEITSLNKVPDAPILVIQETPIYRWALASFP